MFPYNTELIIIGLFLLYGVFARVRPGYAIVGVIMLTPLYLVRMSFVGIPTTALEIMMLATAGGWALYAHQRKISFSYARRIFILGAGLVLLGAALSSLATDAEMFVSSLGATRAFVVEPLIFAFILGAAVKGGVLSREKIALAIIWSALVMGAVTILGGIFDSFDWIAWDGRLRGPFLSPNHLAMFLAPAIPMAGFLLADKTVRTKGIIVSVFLTIEVFFTGSVGALLGVAAGVFVAWVFTGMKKISKKTTLIILAAIAGGVVVFVLKVGLFLEDIQRSSAASRFAIWRAATRILADHPLWGIGVGTFQEYYLSYQKYFEPYLEWAVPQPHNILLATWLQVGLVGAVGFAIVVAAFFRQIWKGRNEQSKKALYAALFGSVVVILIHGLTDTPVWKNDLAVLFWSLLVLI